MIKKFFIIGLALLFCISFVSAQNLSMDEVKQKIQSRLDQKIQVVKDYQCEYVTKTLSSSPRGDFEMESKFNVFFKSPDKRKVEFVEGKRGDRKITAEDMNRRGRGRRSGRGGRFYGMQQQFDVSKYLNLAELLGNEKVDGKETFKLSIRIKDKNDRFKSATVWVDAKTFDVVKIKAKLRPNDRLDSGSVTTVFEPVGPQGFYFPVKQNSERHMVFESPRGVMEIESTTEGKFSNYKFNVGLKDDIFKKEEK